MGLLEKLEQPIVEAAGRNGLCLLHINRYGFGEEVQPLTRARKSVTETGHGPIVVLASDIKPDMHVVLARLVRRKRHPVMLHEEIPDTQLVALPDTSGKLGLDPHELAGGPTCQTLGQRVVVLDAL